MAIRFTDIEIPDGEQLRKLGESNFDGDCPIPPEGKSPYYIDFCKTIYVLLSRIQRLEAEALKNLQR